MLTTFVSDRHIFLHYTKDSHVTVDMSTWKFPIPVAWEAFPHKNWESEKGRKEKKVHSINGERHVATQVKPTVRL